MQTEPEFSKEVLSFFLEKIKNSEFAESIKVEERVYILKDFTFCRDKRGKWQLITGTQQQDIVFYSEYVSKEEFVKGIIKISGAGMRDKVVIPLAICELKVPQSMNTHQLITYSSIASYIKEIFPSCAFYFLLSSNIKRKLMPETVLRQGKIFDRIFLNWDKDKNTIWGDLKTHFAYLKRIGNIK